MKNRFLIITMCLAGVLGISTLALAAPVQETLENAEEKAIQTQLEAEYKQALAEAASQQKEAEASMERAREQLHLAAEQRKKDATEQAGARKAQQADLTRAQEELSRVHRQLRETSREIARVNRELARTRMVRDRAGFVYRAGDHPVIGVILGETDGVGVKVLGVSPDGPSDRAGILPGDAIVALGGTVLAAVEETGDPRKGLNIALEEIRAGEPVVISVERRDQTVDLTVTPQVREPLGWQSVIRFPTAPDSPGETIMIERIEVPEIDTEKLAEQIEQMKIEIGGRRVEIEALKGLPRIDEFAFEFDDMSELGHFVLHDANVWFGLPLTQGLKLAEVDTALGVYFNTERGVLVLKAKTDNDLLLESGDVILRVGNTEVNSPSDFMRAFREFAPGDEIDIGIKRKRKDKSLTVTMPERTAHTIAPEKREKHAIIIRRESN